MAGRGIRLLTWKSGGSGSAPFIGALFELAGMALSLAGRTPAQRPEQPVPTVPGEGVISGDSIVVPEGIVPAELSAAIRRYWPMSLWLDAARVSYYESNHWDSRAVRDTRGRAGGRCGVPIGSLPDGTRIVSEWSIGYFQINACAHGGDFDHWSNADNNVRKAYELYRQHGWWPWTWTAHHIGLL